MKILVTGGAGFIGSHIVDVLISKGHKVVIVDNLSTGKKKCLNKSAKFYLNDIQEDELIKIFKTEKPEVVIHTAAQVMLRDSLRNPINDAKINILGTLNVLEACIRSGVKKIIYTSTGGARVGEPKYMPVDEKHPIEPISPYGISKHTAEHYVKMYHEVYGLDYKIFCFGNVYGPRDDPSTGRITSVFITKLLNKESPKIFGDGNQTRDFIYVDDIAEFIVESINKKTDHKLFHLANGESISVNKMFRILKQISGLELDAEHIKAIPGEIRDMVLDTSLAQKELSWKVKTSFEEGLKKTFEWFKNG